MNCFLHLVLLLIVLSNGCRDTTTEFFTPSDDEHPLFHAPRAMARVQSPELDEISGLGESSRYPGYFWVHNDSGDQARIFLIDTTGHVVVEVKLAGIENRDWEDLATAIDPINDQPYIYIGEIGDNRALYPEYAIYRIQEPVLKSFEKGQKLIVEDVDTYRFTYENGPRDAETLLIDPLQRELLVISKRDSQVMVYSMSMDPSSQPLVLTVQEQLPFTQIVGGDISSDGREILLKTYDKIWYWTRQPNERVGTALQRSAMQLPYIVEPQGEAIGWRKNAKAYLTVSEKGRSSTLPLLYYYQRK